MDIHDVAMMELLPLTNNQKANMSTLYPENKTNWESSTMVTLKDMINGIKCAHSVHFSLNFDFITLDLILPKLLLFSIN